MANLIIKKIEHVALVMLHRPEVRNALNKQILEDLCLFLDEVQTRSDIRAIVFYGSGDKTFCAGADLKERAGMSESQAFSFVELIQATFQKIASCSIPTIAALNGDAFGGGLELALACDMRVGLLGAHYGLTECSLGIIPGAGGTQRLTRIVGIACALKMIMLAERLSGEQAREIGLVNELMSTHAQVVERAQDSALKIAENAPLAVQAAKKAVIDGLDMELSQGLSHELLCYKTILQTKDRLEGLQAFKEKRKPQFKGC